MPTNYDLLKETYAIVGRVEAKLDKIDGRVSDLEIWRAGVKSQVATIAAVFSILIGVPIALLTDWFRKKLNV